MGRTVINSIVLVIYLMMFIYTQQNYEWDILRNLLKDANNFAVHDAAQEIDDDEKSRGMIVFRKSEARSTYEDTLKLNLGLNHLFEPVPGSRLKDRVQILEFVLFDDSSHTFPFLYENDTYKITQLIERPAVLAVIQTDHPRFLGNFIQDPIMVTSVYQIKENRR